MSISVWQRYDISYNTVKNKEDHIIIEDYIANCNYRKRILNLSIIIYVCIYINIPMGLMVYTSNN